MLNSCKLCPRECGAYRGELTGKGFCGCGTTPIISRAALHMWEEPVISGTKGSGTIFFSGCTLGCVFCQNYEISSRLCGKAATPKELAEIMRQLEQSGAHNISFVTGTQYIDAIIEALQIYRPSLPIVWNSGGYELLESIERLADYVDIWLPDYKFGLKDTALKYAHAPDYPETAMNAIKRMCELCGENVIENGIMKKGIIVRHLVLPGNIRNSAAALRRLHAELPKETMISIMSQYIPAGNIALFPELGRRLNVVEYDKICFEADNLGINGFMQELSSASDEYVPDFDTTPIISLD